MILKVLNLSMWRNRAHDLKVGGLKIQLDKLLVP